MILKKKKKQCGLLLLLCGLCGLGSRTSLALALPHSVYGVGNPTTQLGKSWLEVDDFDLLQVDLGLLHVLGRS